MENRNGLLIDVAITIPGWLSPRPQPPLLDRRSHHRQKMSTLGAGKGYHTKGFVALLRSRNVAPHLACI